MDETKARATLQNMQDRWDSPYIDDDSIEQSELIIDGKVTIDELEAIVWWRKNMDGDPLPYEENPAAFSPIDPTAPIPKGEHNVTFDLSWSDRARNEFLYDQACILVLPPDGLVSRICLEIPREDSEIIFYSPDASIARRVKIRDMIVFKEDRRLIILTAPEPSPES